MKIDKKYLLIFITVSIILMILGFYLLNYKEYQSMGYITPSVTNYPYYDIGAIIGFIGLFLLIGTIIVFAVQTILYKWRGKK